MRPGSSILVELALVEGGKPENPEKNPRSKARTNSKLSPRIAPGRYRTLATLVGGERSHHCAIPAPLRIHQAANPMQTNVLNQEL